MIKRKQFSNEFDVLDLKEDHAWIGEVHASQAVEHCSQARARFKALEAAEIGRNWLGGQGFPCKPSRSFLG